MVSSIATFCRYVLHGFWDRNPRPECQNFCLGSETLMDTRYFCSRFELEINLNLKKTVLGNIPHFILLFSCHFEPLVLYRQHLITSNQSNICMERAYLKLMCWNIFKESALNNIDFKLKLECQHFLKQKRKLKHIMKTTDEILLLLLLSRKAISLY